MRDPQGLRRPRFSFFIFTCQTARSRSSIPHLKRAGCLHLPTANSNRKRSAGATLIAMESIKDASTCRGRGPRRCRAQWPGYRPAPSGLSTPVVNKSSHGGKESPAAKKPLFFRGSRRTQAIILRRSGAVPCRSHENFLEADVGFFCALQSTPVGNGWPAGWVTRSDGPLGQLPHRRAAFRTGSGEINRSRIVLVANSSRLG